MIEQTVTGKVPIKDLNIISEELSKLAMEIEEIPQCECGTMSNEQIMRMQQIDFCSQRLQDLSTLISRMSTNVVSHEKDKPISLAEHARLEYTRELFS